MLKSRYMQKFTKDQKEKIKTSLQLLCEDTTSIDKINKIASLIKGTNPVVDKHLVSVMSIVKQIQQVQGGDVIELSAERLPEDNEKNKKRKKLVLLLLSSWKNLQSEVTRISQLQELAATTGVASKETIVKTGKIVATAKGPLGAVTIIAAGIVALAGFLNSKAVNITVDNVGCPAIEPLIEQKINLPGLKLPSEAIEPGTQGTITLPGLDLTVDATQQGTVLLSALNLSRNYDLPYSIKDIIYDGKSLMGKVTEVKLSSSKVHDLIIKCSN